MDRCPADAPLERRPQLTDEERATLEAEAEVLLAKFKRLLMRQRRLPDFDDIGNMGIAHADFVAGWNGISLTPPPFFHPRA